MGNLTLEAFQRASHQKNFKTTEFSFTCNEENVICDDTSKKLIVEEAEIRLHFLSYGLLDKGTPALNEADMVYNKTVVAREVGAEILSVKNRCTSGASQQDQSIEFDNVILKEEQFSGYDIPKLKNFNIARTALTNGYIYLINQVDAGEYYELAVDEYGMLSHILWEYSKDKETGEYLDLRKPKKKKSAVKLLKKGKNFLLLFPLYNGL